MACLRYSQSGAAVVCQLGRIKLRYWLFLCQYYYMNAILQQVRDYADTAHGSQMRKYTPDRYIVHPVRVMELCAAYTTDLPVLAAALLHDVLEDTPVTKEEMHRYLSSVMSPQEAAKTTQLVVELTDVYIKASYPQWNRKKRKEEERERIRKTSPDAQTIKYADILDNCSEIVVHDPSFAKVFLRECKKILAVIPNGHAALYQKAKAALQQAMDENL